MRPIAGMVVGMMAIGIVVTVSLAGGSILECEYFSDQTIVASMKVEDLGKSKSTWTSSRAYGYVSAQGLKPESESGIQGLYTGTLDLPGGGKGRITGNGSLCFPVSGASRGLNKVSLNAQDGSWSSHLEDLGDFVDFVHGNCTLTVSGPPLFKKEGGITVCGPVKLTYAKSSGKISTDRKSFTKYKGKLAIKYTGMVETGPNAGKAVKGKIKVRMKRGVPAGF